MDESKKYLCYGCNRMQIAFLKETKATSVMKDGSSAREVTCKNCGALSLLYSWGFISQEKKVEPMPRIMKYTGEQIASVEEMQEGFEAQEAAQAKAAVLAEATRNVMYKVTFTQEVEFKTEEEARKWMKAKSGIAHNQSEEFKTLIRAENCAPMSEAEVVNFNVYGIQSKIYGGIQSGRLGSFTLSLRYPHDIGEVPDKDVW